MNKDVSYNKKEFLKQEFDISNFNRILIDKSPDAVIIIKNNQIVECNSVAIQMFQYKHKDDFLGMSINDLSHGNKGERDFVDKQIDQLFFLAKEGGNYRTEWFFFNRNKEIFYSEIVLIALEGTEGLYFVQIRDIKEKMLFEEELALQKSLFQQLFENSPEAIIMLDNNDRVVSINQSFEQTFLYSLEEIKGKPINDIIVPETYFVEASNLSNTVLSGEFVRTESVRKRKDGSLIDVSIVGYPIVSNQKQVGIYGIFQDISYRKQSERKLNLFAKVLENNTEGVVITDCSGKIQWVNKAFTAITGYSEVDVIGQKTNILKSGRHSTDFYGEMWQSILTKGKWQGEVWNKRKNGEIYAEYLSIFVIEDENGVPTHYASILSDITVSKEREEKINFLAFRDSLTGLYNRAMFTDRLNLELAKAKRKNQLIALLFIDLDEFKGVNDNYGHSIGDLLLKSIAERLISVTRESDTVARVGGDEFIIVIPDITDEEQIKIIAEKILSVFDEPWEIDNNTFNIAASVGISVYPKDGVAPADLINSADSAMYRAKDKGHNQYEFYSSIKGSF